MRILSVALAALALCAMPASAQQRAGGNSDYQGQVRNYLSQQAGKHTSEGFRPDTAVPDIIRPLRLEGGVIWPVQLRRGVTYRVFAVCDNDCSDVDLEVYDAAGAFVGRDVAVNDTPYVEITPAADGVAYARIWLAACESEPCYVGARLFRRGQ